MALGGEGSRTKNVRAKSESYIPQSHFHHKLNITAADQGPNRLRYEPQVHAICLLRCLAVRIKNILVSCRVKTPTGLTPLAIPVFQVTEIRVIDDDAPLSEESPWVDEISGHD